MRLSQCPPSLLFCVAVSACGSDPAPSPAQTAAPPLASSAPAQAPTPTGPPAASPAGASGLHEHKAPRGGALIELGEEFAHLEFVVDKATGKAVLYSLDGEAEKGVRLKQKEIILDARIGGRIQSLTFIFLATANPLTGETVGDSSEFTVVAEEMKGVDHFEGVIREVTSRGTIFSDVSVKYPGGTH